MRHWLGRTPRISDSLPGHDVVAVRTRSRRRPRSVHHAATRHWCDGLAVAQLETAQRFIVHAVVDDAMVVRAQAGDDESDVVGWETSGEG